MIKHLLFLLVLAGSVHAQARNSPLPQDQPLPATLAAVQKYAEDVATIGITVNLGLGPENPTWAMTRTAKEVFLANLMLPVTPTVADKITMQAKHPAKEYKGLTLRLTLTNGRPFRDIHIYNGRVTGTGGLIKQDIGRRLEYLTWGTARVRRENVMAARVMPTLTFEHCRLMAQQVVETTPRQCLLPDGDLMIETSTPLTARVLKSTDFDSCLYNGIGLINTFPRRCVAEGGRVFAEPPRIYDVPPDAPLASTITNPLDPTLPKQPEATLSGSTFQTEASTTVPPANQVSATLQSEGLNPAVDTVSPTTTSASTPLLTRSPAASTTLPAEVTTGLPEQTVTPPTPLPATPSATAFPTPQPLTTGGFESTPTPIQPTLPVSPSSLSPYLKDDALTSPPITVPSASPSPATVPAVLVPVNRVQPQEN